jgi:hypothetical protein|tara:strand:- start:234 stop:515 length:282 start_codon:yes stop_codon:yes gene_type:complete
MGKLKPKAPEQHGIFPKHIRSDEELKSYIWCFNNGIKIGPVPLWGKSYGSWTVEIRMNGKINTDPQAYEKSSIMYKVYEYCDYYYNKYKKDGE